ncbi:DUF6527 family protein [Paraburkholderia sp. MM5384-R2]|uniref:DUF6527 family protein n=1 Tax=Paraburkholderia sp. MM5384-R2 TaxID=2723097 RepID=UPI001614D0F5|nr:DUF6527 family protein [Paraburkholderia sp. MM5384-R2]MBB5498646.1 hypothetical protein [Paraburkholderia sp. MM5384-R2]
MKINRFKPQFVEYIPDKLEAGILYLSMEFATASHACACGCNREVVTPLSPVGWRMRYDGENVSLEPSIGNWSYPCKSHYWIKGGTVRWDAEMPQWAIDEGRERDRNARTKHYARRSHPAVPAAQVEERIPQLPAATQEATVPASRTWWDILIAVFRQK